MNDAVFKFEDLLEELQIDILSRLPPKPQSLYKCVSKHWYTTLTIQAFMLRHSRSYDKHSKLAFVALSTTNVYDSVFSFELCDNTAPNRKTMTVPKTTKTEIDSEELIIGRHDRFTEALFHRNYFSNICNDLVCLFDWFSPRVGLLNLKTQDFIHLPTVTTQRRLGGIKFWYALGFDTVNRVYKVLSIHGGSEVCPATAVTFTLGSSKHWKPVEYKFLRSAAIMKRDYWRNNNRLCLDGVIYWVNDYEIHGASVLTVVAFDLNREVFTDYKLDTIPIKDIKKIRYYLTSLKGCPTLFVWKKESEEIQQLTLFNHKNPKVTWSRRSFTAHDFPRNFPYGCPWTFVAGGSILLQSVKPIKSSVKSREQDKSVLSWHRWYDLENFTIE